MTTNRPLPPLEYEEIFVPKRHRRHSEKSTRRVVRFISIANREAWLREHKPSLPEAVIRSCARDYRFKT